MFTVYTVDYDRLSCLNLLVDFLGTDGHAIRVHGDEADVCLRIYFRHTWAHLVSVLASYADDVHAPTEYLLQRPERKGRWMKV